MTQDAAIQSSSEDHTRRYAFRCIVCGDLRLPDICATCSYVASVKIEALVSGLFSQGRKGRVI